MGSLIIAAPALVAGFGDQFLPALIAVRSDDEFWRFVLAGLAVTQLVFMSEFGMIVLRSPLPISLRMLAGPARHRADRTLQPSLAADAARQSSDRQRWRCALIVAL